MQRPVFRGLPVERLKDGNHFFGFVPNNIGEMVYCDSSNYCATKEENHKTLRVVQWIFLVVSVGLLALFYYLYTGGTERSESLWLCAMIVALIGACVSLYKLLTPVVFKGIDYFVGTEGFALIYFNGSRSTFVKNENVYFKDIVSFNYKIEDAGREDITTFFYFHLLVKDSSGIIVEQNIRTKENGMIYGETYDGITDCASRFWKRAYEEWQEWQSRH